MAILGSFAEFRRLFSREVEETASFSFVNGTSRITRASGSFLSMPKANGGGNATMWPGSTIEVTGTTSNNGILTATDIQAGYVEVNETLTTEGPVSCTLRGVPRGNDDLPEWPLSNVRANSFDGGIVGMPAPYTGLVITLVANGTAGSPTADAAAGTDEYHWYLSQRTDEPARQLWSATPYVDGTSSTYSGAILIGPTALNASLYDLSIDSEDLAAVLRHVHLYCLRISDGAIQGLDLYRAAQGAT